VQLVLDRQPSHARGDIDGRQRVALEPGPAVLDERRSDEPEHAGRGDPVRHPARVEQVAIQLVGAGSQHRRLDARQVEVQRVVDGDGAGREPEEAEAAVAPRLGARPPEHLGDVLLGAGTQRVERAVAQPGAPDVHLEVVVVRAAELRAAPGPVRAELHDDGPAGQHTSDQGPAPTQLHLELDPVRHRDAQVPGNERARVRGPDGGRHRQHEGADETGERQHTHHPLPSPAHAQ
jgi:hypothetical protein